MRRSFLPTPNRVVLTLDLVRIFLDLLFGFLAFCVALDVDLTRSLVLLCHFPPTPFPEPAIAYDNIVQTQRKALTGQLGVLSNLERTRSAMVLDESAKKRTAATTIDNPTMKKNKN